jgi:hypothetical protein
MKFSAFTWSLALAVVSTVMIKPAQAQTVDSRCDIYPKGSDRASKVVNCTFSQRQGGVRIILEDGTTYELSPSATKANHYIDQDGREAYREDGGMGNTGQIYRLATESIFIYWDERAPGSNNGSNQTDRIPETVPRQDGGVDVLMPGGCVVLYDRNGSRVSAGASCSENDLNQSRDVIDTYRREQGLVY